MTRCFKFLAWLGSSWFELAVYLEATSLQSEGCTVAAARSPVNTSDERQPNRTAAPLRGRSNARNDGAEIAYTGLL